MYPCRRPLLARHPLLARLTVAYICTLPVISAEHIALKAFTKNVIGASIRSKDPIYSSIQFFVQSTIMALRRTQEYYSSSQVAITNAHLCIDRVTSIIFNDLVPIHIRNLSKCLVCIVRP